MQITVQVFLRYLAQNLVEDFFSLVHRGSNVLISIPNNWSGIKSSFFISKLL